MAAWTPPVPANRGATPPQMEALMSQQRDLIVSSLFFAAFWTVAMILINAPGAAGAVILTAAGALAGALWYTGMRWWTKTRA
jgi:hypothetical protein